MTTLSPIETFDKANVEAIKLAVTQAISALVIDANLGVKIEGFKAGTHSMTLNIKLTTDGCDHRTDAELEYLAECGKHLLPESALNTELVVKEGFFAGKRVTILGARWSCRKYPIIIGVHKTTRAGPKIKKYRCMVSTIVNALRAAGQLTLPTGTSFSTKSTPTKTFNSKDIDP